MIKLHCPLVMTLMFAATGCAQQPVHDSQNLSAEAARYGVSQTLLVSARRAGYSPEIQDGETYFCTEQVQSFSYIPKARCLDAAHMAEQLQGQAAAVGDLRDQVSTRSFVSPENGGHVP